MTYTEPHAWEALATDPTLDEENRARAKGNAAYAAAVKAACKEEVAAAVAITVYLAAGGSTYGYADLKGAA